MADLKPGATFAGHRIEGIAGRGGMGTVYRATHLALDHVVALKVISADLAADDAFRERFRSESRIAVSLRHPNVVPIHHAGEEDGLPFVTMDLIDGPDLRRMLIAGGPLPPERAVPIVAQVAAALDVAHSRGLVHRDIKPGNILVEQRANGEEHVYLTDFGLAKRFDQPTEASALTGTGAFVGTLDYVAPEQIRGERIDARTDVYALGCVLYEALSGRAPFADREEQVAKIYAHLQDEPPWLPGDLEGLDETIARALAKAPDDRFPSAGDLARSATAACSGVEARAIERSVATGRAAPIVGDETQESVAPEPGDDTVEIPPLATGASPAAAPDSPDPPQPQRLSADRERRRPVVALIGGAVLIGLVVAAVALLGGGGEGGGGSDPASTTAGGSDSPPTDSTGTGEAFVDADAILIEGFPVGLTIHDRQVSVATRNGRALETIVKTTRESAARVDLPGRGEDVAIQGRFAYVTLPDDDVVARVPLDGGAVTTIGVGDQPRGVVASGGSVWVANLGSGTVSQIDGVGGVSQITLPEGAEPTAIDFSVDTLWVSDRTGNVIRVVLGAAPQSFPVGRNPKGVVVAEGDVWVANTDDGTVSRLSAEGDPIREIEVDGTPRGVAAGFGRIWVANGDGYVSAIDIADDEAVQRIPIDEGLPEEVAVGPERVWVTTGSGDSLVSIDPGGVPASG